MSYKLFFCCDFKGCRNTDQIPVEATHKGWESLPKYELPNGWLSVVLVVRSNPIELLREPMFICPEHAKLLSVDMQEIEELKKSK